MISVEKCCVITFLRFERNIDISCKLSDFIAQCSNEVFDSGVILDSKLNFNFHYKQTISKALKMLRRICKLANDFNDLTCLEALYVCYGQYLSQMVYYGISTLNCGWINLKSYTMSVYTFARNFSSYADYGARRLLLGLKSLQSLA